MRLNPMLIEMRNDRESIEATIELPLERHSNVSAASHQHEQVRKGHECRQGPQDVIGEAGQPGRDCDGPRHLM
jgi:hypothetical protein